MLGSFVEAYLLKQTGDKYNHIIILGFLFAAAAINQLQKAVKKNEDSSEQRSNP